MELWDVAAWPRDADTIFVTLNNWHRGDYEPYIVKSADRGGTWTNITGDLPDRSRGRLSSRKTATSQITAQSGLERNGESR